MAEKILLVECMRDAMQGRDRFIPTPQKIAYLNLLLQAGFHTLDCVSFVSAKAIPQMADSAAVLAGIYTTQSNSRLLAIVANERGAAEACGFGQIHYLGYPFSISETFQLRNTNSTIGQSWERVKHIAALCRNNGKEMVVYISMGFGNPYGDPYNEAVIAHWAEKMAQEGIRIISLADTVGLATPEMVQRITEATIRAFPALEIGVHLHSTREGMAAKAAAALTAGCRRFDGALKGIGGCPMAGNALVGNMDTELMVKLLEGMGFETGLDMQVLKEAAAMAADIFN